MNLENLTLALAQARTHVEVVDLARRYVAQRSDLSGGAMELLDAVTAAHGRIRCDDQRTADKLHRKLAAGNEPYYATPAPLPTHEGRT